MTPPIIAAFHCRGGGSEPGLGSGDDVVETQKQEQQKRAMLGCNMQTYDLNPEQCEECESHLPII